jgi:sterol desaturase/sphingolipid hydroxylase (fatty acid hydroxylase superfamily)
MCDHSCTPTCTCRGPPKYLIVTPDFHRWQHASDDQAIDRNHATHHAFVDYLSRIGQQRFRRGNKMPIEAPR